MENILNAAAYIVKKYHEISGEPVDPTKLQKLLYFTQRESIAITGEPALSGTFEGWRNGPVCRDVYYAFRAGTLLSYAKDISDELAYIINNVIHTYGIYDKWKLSEMSHQEISWRRARIGLDPEENGRTALRMDDIREDAKKVRPYDNVWDMFYDEFEDAE